MMIAPLNESTAASNDSFCMCASPASYEVCARSRELSACPAASADNSATARQPAATARFDMVASEMKKRQAPRGPAAALSRSCDPLENVLHGEPHLPRGLELVRLPELVVQQARIGRELGL